MGRRPVCVLCLLLIAFLCIADRLGIPLIRGNPLPDNLKAWIEKQQKITVCGETVRCVDTEFSQSVYLKDAYLIYNSEKVSIGNVRVFLKKREELPAGSLILVSGKPEAVEGPRNPGEFDSRQYYACRHIYYFMKDAVVKRKSESYSGYRQFLLTMQARFTKILERTAGEAAPVFEAMVLGDKSDLETETKLRFQMAGIIHILAISGLHISVLGVGLYQLLKRLGLGIWPAGMISLVIMLQYGMMTGGGVSTMRAVCMFLLSVGAKILGRIYDMYTALAVAAILILVESPAYLLDGGFWLSFGAVVGVGAAAPRLVRIFGIKRKIPLAFVSSLSVQMTTLPVMLWFFGEVSLAGILLNLFVLPTVGAVLVSGVGTVLAGLISIPAARVCALPGRVLLAGYELLCKTAGELPFCTWIGGKPEAWQAAVYYAILAAAFWICGNKCSWMWIKKSDEHMLLWKKNGLCACLLGTAVMLLAYRPTEEFRITALDIGQGDAVVVEAPDGEVILIDCGSSNKKGICQYQLLPYLKYRGISRIDAVFVSHTDKDHINGIFDLLEYMGESLTSVHVENLVLPGWKNPPEAYMELVELAERANVTVRTGNAGNIFRVGELNLEVLSPRTGSPGQEINEEGMVMELDYRGFRALFTGDIGEKTEKALLKDLCDVDFLKVAHHGSGGSTCEAFLEKTRPEIAVISVSSTNTYGHPSPDTISRLKACGSQVEYTMKNGAVTVLVGKNGKITVTMTVKSE